MRIFALSVVKNEADVIEHNLCEACKWADQIFVLDNGSTDGTWEKVQALASEQIVPWKQTFAPFYDGIRGELFHAFQHLATKDDWWCFRLDADEFYADDPRAFLAAVPRRYHFVASASIHFWLTPEDLQEHPFVGEASVDLPHIRYYEKKTWSEARFFRHRPGLEWPAGAEHPRHMGVLYPLRIHVKHYQYRSLQQIAKRVHVRLQAREQGFVGWDHAINEDPASYLSERSQLRRYEPGQPWHLDGSHNKYYQRYYDQVLKWLLHAAGIYK